MNNYGQSKATVPLDLSIKKLIKPSFLFVFSWLYLMVFVVCLSDEAGPLQPSSQSGWAYRCVWVAPALLVFETAITLLGAMGVRSGNHSDCQIAPHFNGSLRFKMEHTNKCPSLYFPVLVIATAPEPKPKPPVTGTFHSPCLNLLLALLMHVCSNR